MTIKIAFGTTILDQGLAGKGIDGIGQYCQELKNQFSQTKRSKNISLFFWKQLQPNQCQNTAKVFSLCDGVTAFSQIQ